MKTLDDAVIELNGVLPDSSYSRKTSSGYYIHEGRISCTGIILGGVEQFQQRAKELGFINGYRWGVEYKTDGKRPDLPDYVEIKWQAVGVKEWWPKHDNTTAGELDWNGKYAVYSFKITDTLHEPADTSYLEKPALEPIHEEENWWDYENDKPISWPPLGAECLCVDEDEVQTAFVIGFDFFNEDRILWRNKKENGTLWYGGFYSFKPLDHDRKAKAERKKVVDAAYKEIGTVSGNAYIALERAYDKGFLKLPESKGE